MNIHITPLHRTVRLHVPRHIQIIILLVALIAPAHSLAERRLKSYEQEYLITAYYSPLPGQCCYVTGGYKADKVLNGEGHTAADGTAVYPGMLAAPKSYAFGTVVRLPGVGTLTVHDRGGAITELGNGIHRLDIWVGHGEEGLARALAFGVQRIKGTVYPVGARQPETHVVLEDLPAPLNRLDPFFVERGNLLAVRPKAGERGLSVSMLQEHLRDLGYFQHAITGLFGLVTQQSLAAFIRDYEVKAPIETLNNQSAAILVAAEHRLKARQPLGDFVDKKSAESLVSEAQRLLRFLGYYRGRTHGQYDDNLADSILSFQQDYGLVGTQNDLGAGRIGPITRKTIRSAWNRLLVYSYARKLLDLHTVDQKTAERGQRIEQFLGEGDSGSQVQILQKLLVKRGFFPEEMINGNFGALTKESVTRYQLASGVIDHWDSEGAGYVGPSTLSMFRREERLAAYKIVRGEGWRAL